ncbi:MAG TPA: bacteriocin family protein [Chloroflexi bacterium]|nr:bacteriocin family protein [Chloroflexota bacterium]
MSDIQIVSAHTDGSQALRGSFNPRDTGIIYDKHDDVFRRNSAQGERLVVNSLLTVDEWIEVENQVLQASRYPLKVVEGFRRRGLVKPLGSVGSLEARWYVSSDITAAGVSMTGRGRAERDLPELRPASVPVPVIFKEFSVDWRTLEASRRMGDGLDMTTLVEAVRVVAEGYENLVVNGSTAVTLNGAPIYGLRTHPNRNTDTAGNYGGGDWGTIANIVPTIAGMVSAANAQHNYGPFHVYISQTQFNQAAMSFYNDGSGSALNRIKSLDMIEGVEGLPPTVLPDGEILLLQMTAEYMDLAEAMSIQVREWTSGDGLESMFKVMTIGTPEIKARFGNQTGIVHATGA